METQTEEQKQKDHKPTPTELVQEWCFDHYQPGEEFELGDVVAGLHMKESTVKQELALLVGDGVFATWEDTAGEILSYEIPEPPKRGTTAPTKEFTAAFIPNLEPKRDREVIRALRKELEDETGCVVRAHYDRWHKDGPQIRLKIGAPRERYKEYRENYTGKLDIEAMLTRARAVAKEVEEEKAAKKAAKEEEKAKRKAEREAKRKAKAEEKAKAKEAKEKEKAAKKAAKEKEEEEKKAKAEADEKAKAKSEEKDAPKSKAKGKGKKNEPEEQPQPAA